MYSITKETILKKLITGVVMAVVFTPLLFYRYFFYPFVTTKVFAFRLLIELAVVLFAINFFKQQKVRCYKSPIWWLYLSLVVISFAAAIFGVNYTNSFWSNIERADGLLMLIHVFALFVLAVFAIDNINKWRWIFRLSLIATLFVVAYGLMQHFEIFYAISTTGGRLSSTLGNAAYLGSYLIINLFLALYLLYSDKYWFWRIFYIVTVILSFITIFMTQTRGAILGVLGGLFLLAILSIFRGDNKKYVKQAGMLVMILIILFLVSIYAFKDATFIKSNETLSRLTSISYDNYTTRSRLVAWEAAVKGFKDRPILGWGPENYNYAFSKYFPPEIYADSGSQLWFDKAHSVLFEYLVTTGLVGVINYFALLLLVIYYLFKTKNLKRFESNVLIALLAGYTFANMFVFDTINTYILFALILAFVNNMALERESKAKDYQLNPA